MGKIDKKKVSEETVEYTFDLLLTDIAEINEKGKIYDNVKREYHSKLIVIQMLICLANSYKTEDYKDDKKLSNAIDIEVKGNELLSGYIFFISQNSQFDYSWGYLRKCEINFKEFLINSVRFLNNVLTDINMLAAKPIVGRNMHVVFHDILDITFTSVRPFVKACLLWENFYRLVTVKSEYNISVKVNECILMVCGRKEPSDTGKLIDAALKKLTTTY